MIGRRSSRDAQRPAHREAVTVGEREVEQHEVDVAAGGAERVAAFEHVGDLEAFAFEGSHQWLGDGEVVFDEQDRGHGASVRRGVGPVRGSGAERSDRLGHGVAREGSRAERIGRVKKRPGPLVIRRTRGYGRT